MEGLFSKPGFVFFNLDLRKLKLVIDESGRT